MKKHFLFLVILSSSLILLISSCSLLTPEIAIPDANIPSNWLSSVNQDKESNLAYTAWWQRFNDPILNQLIESGLNQNNSIKIANANIDIARGQLRALELSWLPSLAAVIGYSTNPLFGSPGGIYGASLGYSDFNPFTLIARQKSAKLRVIAQEQALAISKLNLIAQISLTYFTLIAQQQQAELFKEYQHNLQEMLNIQIANFKNGLSSEMASKEYAEQLDLLISQQKTIENNINLSQNALHYLLNQNPGTFKTLTNFKQLNNHYANTIALPASVIGNRPDIVMKATEYKIASQNVAVSYTQLLPEFSLDYGPAMVQVGSQATPNGTAASFQDEYMMWTLNPSIFGNIEAMAGSQKAAYFSYIDAVKMALRDINNDLTSSNNINQQVTAINAALNHAQEKYLLTQGLYQHGIIAYQETLNDKLNVDKALLSLNQIRLQQFLAAVKLYHDIGGGYNYNTQP